MNVYDNIAFGLSVKKVDKQTIKEKVTFSQAIRVLLEAIPSLSLIVIIIGGITGGICLLVWLLSGMADFTSPIDQNLLQAHHVEFNPDNLPAPVEIRRSVYVQLVVTR